ncbi:MAG: biotin/lipoyl-containing protein [Vicinamibacterales bacterium]
MEFRYQVGDEIKVIRVERAGDGYHVSIGDRAYTVSVTRSASGEMVLIVNGERHTAHVVSSGSTLYAAIDGNTLGFTRPDTSRARRHPHGEDSLTASMPGQVMKVLVAEGDSVERGQALMILEAMKMEIRVAAPHTGRVAKVSVSEGQVVDRGQVLVELTADE